MAANDVKILVKNVYMPAEAQQFVVVDSLAVRALKEMIAAALPDNPLPRHQKLIFGGKICDDDDTLAKVLAGQSKDDDAAPFVFHLMVSSAVPRSRPTTPTAPVARAPPVVAEQPTTSPEPVPATPSRDTSATDGVAPAQPHVAPPGFPFVGFFGAAPATAATPAAPASHHGNHHHLYTQAILMQQQAMILSQIQYLQQLQAHHANSAQAGAPPAAPTAGAHQAHGMFPAYGHYGHPFAHHGYGMPQHAYGHGAHAAPHVAPGFPGVHAPAMHFPGAAVAPAAAPAVAEPRERGPIAQAFHEILPLFDIRLAMKMTFMLFIIGQDTPTDRLIVLALMSFGAYLHITGILGKVYELLKRSRGEQGNGNGNGNQPGGENANPNGAVDAPGRLNSIARYLRISSDRGFVHDVRYFITGLLLSLVPAWHPQPLQVDPAAPQRQEPGIADAAQDIPLQGI